MRCTSQLQLRCACSIQVILSFLEGDDPDWDSCHAAYAAYMHLPDLNPKNEPFVGTASSWGAAVDQLAANIAQAQAAANISAAVIELLQKYPHSQAIESLAAAGILIQECLRQQDKTCPVESRCQGKTCCNKQQATVQLQCLQDLYWPAMPHRFQFLVVAWMLPGWCLPVLSNDQRHTGIPHKPCLLVLQKHSRSSAASNSLTFCHNSSMLAVKQQQTSIRQTQPTHRAHMLMLRLIWCQWPSLLTSSMYTWC